MDPITCRFCGESVRVTSLDLPLAFREDPASASGPAQFVIIGAGCLLHHCAIPAEINLASDPSPHSNLVHQAQGMVSMQADCTMDEALALMRNSADAAEVTLDELAAHVIDRDVRFDPPR